MKKREIKFVRYINEDMDLELIITERGYTLRTLDTKEVIDKEKGKFEEKWVLEWVWFLTYTHPKSWEKGDSQ